MPRKLKIWNGGGPGGRGDHFYICAHSVAEAARLLAFATKVIKSYTWTPSQFDIDRCKRRITDYFSKDCWGDPMEGIVPELGVWYSQADNVKPYRIDVEISYPKKDFKPTHMLAYDKGVWLPVMRRDRLWEDETGRTFGLRDGQILTMKDYNDYYTGDRKASE